MRKFCLLSLVSLVALGSVRAGEGSIEIVQPWVRAVPSSMKATAAYFVIKNGGTEPVSLVGGSTVVAKTVVPMISTKRDEGGQEVLGMQTVPELAIPAGGEIVLEPGGDHLMLMKLRKLPKVGEAVEITLKFEPGDREVTILAPVLMDAPKP
jgi:hypothetical protein